MLCQNCQKNEATTFLKRTVNGQTTETRLCAECAAQQGLNPFIDNSKKPTWAGFDLGDFWGSIFAQPDQQVQKDTVRCEGCGIDFNQMTRTGKAGCPMCYTTFYDRLLPSIQRIHGKARHTGKIPAGAGEGLKKERKLEQLRQELNQSIAQQKFEDCAQIRDQIRELEQQKELENKQQAQKQDNQEDKQQDNKK